MKDEINLSKYAALESAKLRRVALLSRHADELSKIEEEISKEQIKLGLGPYFPEGRKRQPVMAAAKKKYHDELRAEAVKKGYYVTEGRKKGRPDVERVRLERKAKELSESEGKAITPIDVAKREAAEKAKTAQERLKSVKAKR